MPGSCLVGLSQKEFEALTPTQQQISLDRAKDTLLNAGADDVLLTLSELPDWLISHT